MEVDDRRLIAVTERIHDWPFDAVVSVFIVSWKDSLRSGLRSA